MSATEESQKSYNNNSFQFQHFNEPEGNVHQFCETYSQFKNWNSKKFSLTTNSYCLIEDWIVEVNNIILGDGQVYIIGKKFLFKSSFYEYPMDSDTLLIFKIANLSSKINVYNSKSILCKCLLIPCKDYFVSFPLLHTF